MSEEKKDSKDKFAFLKNLSFVKKLKQVKHIGLYIVIIFVLILLVILFGGFGTSQTSAITTSNKNVTYSSAIEYESFLEDKLKMLIANIKDAGNVEVMVSVEGGTTVEQSSQSESKANSSNTASANFNVPKIRGVVVVSSGAKNVAVRLDILSAVQTLLGLDESQIKILVGK